MKKNRILRNQRGQGLTEYIVLLMCIAVAAIGVTQTLGKSVKEKIKISREKINDLQVD